MFIVSIVLLSATTGCKVLHSFDKKTPEHIVKRYGPTADQKIKEINELGGLAADGTAARQEQISAKLAAHVRVEENANVRVRVMRAIANCRTPVAMSVLQAGMSDEDLDVQLAACEALGRIGGPQAVGLLGQVVADRDADFDLRLAATKSLGKLNSPQAVYALGSALQEKEDPALQLRAARSLAKISGEDYGNNLVAWREFVARQAPASIVQQQQQPTSPSFVKRFAPWRQ